MTHVLHRLNRYPDEILTLSDQDLNHLLEEAKEKKIRELLQLLEKYDWKRENRPPLLIKITAAIPEMASDAVFLTFLKKVGNLSSLPDSMAWMNRQQRKLSLLESALKSNNIPLIEALRKEPFSLYETTPSKSNLFTLACRYPSCKLWQEIFKSMGNEELQLYLENRASCIAYIQNGEDLQHFFHDCKLQGIDTAPLVYKRHRVGNLLEYGFSFDSLQVLFTQLSERDKRAACKKMGGQILFHLLNDCPENLELFLASLECRKLPFLPFFQSRFKPHHLTILETACREGKEAHLKILLKYLSEGDLNLLNCPKPSMLSLWDHCHDSENCWRLLERRLDPQ